jgi:hypothetical protein
MKLSRISVALILVVLGFLPSVQLTESKESRRDDHTRGKAEVGHAAANLSKADHNKKARNQATNKNAPADMRGTEEQPLIIKSLITSEAVDKLERERAPRDEEASNSWWMRLWTAVAAIAAFGTALIAGVAACVAIHTLKAIKEQVAANNTAAEAAQTTAKVMHEEFITSHRPKITVRMMDMWSSTDPRGSHQL